MSKDHLVEYLNKPLVWIWVGKKSSSYVVYSLLSCGGIKAESIYYWDVKFSMLKGNWRLYFNLVCFYFMSLEYLLSWFLFNSRLIKEYSLQFVEEIYSDILVSSILVYEYFMSMEGLLLNCYLLSGLLEVFLFMLVNMMMFLYLGIYSYILLLTGLVAFKKV